MAFDPQYVADMEMKAAAAAGLSGGYAQRDVRAAQRVGPTKPLEAIANAAERHVQDLANTHQFLLSALARLGVSPPPPRENPNGATIGAVGNTDGTPIVHRLAHAHEACARLRSDIHSLVEALDAAV